jgi:acetyl esterase/lipase
MLRALGILLVCVCALLAQNNDPAKTLPDWVTFEPDLSYGDASEQKVDVYIPKQSVSGKRPAVLLIHGGRWTGGSRKSMYPRHVMPYLEKGFVVVSLGYRLSGVAKAPAAVSDALLALDWLHNNSRRFSIDSNRIITAGSSAGGHLALMVGMVNKQAKLGPTRNVAAIINICGPVDLADLNTEAGAGAVNAWLPEGQERAEVARLVSPINYARKGLPPVKSVHGTEDPQVPYDHSVRLTRALRNHGVTAELLSVPGGGHDFESAVWKTKVYPQIFEFLERQRVLR